MFTLHQTLTRKLASFASVVGIASTLLLATAMPIYAQSKEPAPVEVEPSRLEQAEKPTSEEPEAKMEDGLVKQITESAKRRLAESPEVVDEETVKKTFDGFPVLETELETVKEIEQAQYAKGFNLYLQCWDGVLVLRAFDDNGTCIPPVSGGGAYGEVEIGTCKGRFWEIRLLHLK